MDSRGYKDFAPNGADRRRPRKRGALHEFEDEDDDEDENDDVSAIEGTSRFRRSRYLSATETKGRHRVLQLGQGDWLRSEPR